MDAYGLIKVVSLSKDAVPLKLIVNMANSKEEAKEIASRVILLSRRFLNTFVESYGFIFRDKAVLNSVMSQKPFSVLHPDSKAANCVKEIAEKISDRFSKDRGMEKKGNNLTEAFKKVFDISGNTI